MGIGELLMGPIIEFPKSLSLEETNELLNYIAVNLPAKISTKTEIYCIRYHDEKENKGFQKTQINLEICGTIMNNNNFNFDNFITRNYILDSSRILGINFQAIPGYKLEEHRLEVRQLWADVRKQVENYFSEKVI